MAMAQGQEAGLAFVSFLKASKVPESLWEPLLEKIDRAEVGCEGGVQVYHSYTFHSNKTDCFVSCNLYGPFKSLLT